MDPHRTLRLSSRLALLAAFLILAMAGAAIAGGGVTQQHFERAAEPRAWNAELAEAAQGTLRWFLYFDNLFVLAFSTCLVAAARGLHALRPHALSGLAIGAILGVALLDFGENLHLQVGIHRLLEAPRGMWADRGEIQLWSFLSLMKWHLAYLSLFAFSFLVPQDTVLERLLVWSLRLALIPIGVAVGVLTGEEAAVFEILRLALMLLGFLMLAAVLARLAGGSALARAAAAGPPGSSAAG